MKRRRFVSADTGGKRSGGKKKQAAASEHAFFGLVCMRASTLCYALRQAAASSQQQQRVGARREAPQLTTQLPYRARQRLRGGGTKASVQRPTATPNARARKRSAVSTRMDAARMSQGRHTPMTTSGAVNRECRNSAVAEQQAHAQRRVAARESDEHTAFVAREDKPLTLRNSLERATPRPLCATRGATARGAASVDVSKA